ncbi:hypothetical protein [Cryobacterium sp. Y29]|uniref:hypothetical protein n=1 Tax=Cryobacterium sp. Y29 TaxID=2048285 RepID=UPI001304D04A|nr:hypothetical protein [Cryobacterium sp. Y29]
MMVLIDRDGGGMCCRNRGFGSGKTGIQDSPLAVRYSSREDIGQFGRGLLAEK